MVSHSIPPLLPYGQVANNVMFFIPLRVEDDGRYCDAPHEVKDTKERVHANVASEF